MSEFSHPWRLRGDIHFFMVMVNECGTTLHYIYHLMISKLKKKKIQWLHDLSHSQWWQNLPVQLLSLPPGVAFLPSWILSRPHLWHSGYLLPTAALLCATGPVLWRIAEQLVILEKHRVLPWNHVDCCCTAIVCWLIVISQPPWYTRYGHLTVLSGNQVTQLVAGFISFVGWLEQLY